MGRTHLILAGLATAGVLTLSACGSGAQDQQVAPQAQTQTQGHDMSSMQGHDMSSMSGATSGTHHGDGGVELWAVQSGPLGTVVTDAAGHVMHRYDGDTAAPSTTTCTEDCAAEWPPVLLADGERPALMGVDESKVGTVTREDGTKQVTLAGWPLYRYAGDDGSLSTAAGQGTGGVWFAVAPDGSKAVTP
jgi:predicted lipoprotein with Yx(FWY)xxD motif